MSNEKKPSLSPKIQALSDSILKDISVDKETGIGNPGEKNVFEKNLPSTLTMENVKNVNDYTRDFVTASIHAAGQASVAAMAGNKKLEKVEFTFPLEGRDKMEVGFARSQSVTNSLTQKTDTYYCNPSFKVQMRAAKRNSGLNDVFKLVREEGAKKLS